MRVRSKSEREGVELTFRLYARDHINTQLEVGLKTARKISVVQAKEAAQIISEYSDCLFFRW